MSEKESTSKGEQMIVSIGPSYSSLPSPEKVTASKAKWVFVDPDYGVIARVDELMTMHLPPIEALLKMPQCTFYPSLDSAGISEGSVDEFRMCDVLNSDTITYNYEDQDDEADKLLAAFTRLLHPKGRIVIGANNQPNGFSVERVEKIAGDHKLRMEILLHFPYSRCVDELAQKIFQDRLDRDFEMASWLEEGAYVVVLRKVGDETNEPTSQQ